MLLPKILSEREYDECAKGNGRNNQIRAKALQDSRNSILTDFLQLGRSAHITPLRRMIRQQIPLGSINICQIKTQKEQGRKKNNQ